MAKLTLLMGCPGSGKSTWASNHLDKNTVIISRDDVRFDMVSEDEEYFSKEKEVFKEFIRNINLTIECGYDVFADATHLNEASRNKLIRSISVPVDEINIVWIKTDLNIALERNENRKGTRAYVPRGVIRRMFYQMTPPSFEEGFKNIYVVRTDRDEPIQHFKEG